MFYLKINENSRNYSKYETEPLSRMKFTFENVMNLPTSVSLGKFWPSHIYFRWNSCCKSKGVQSAFIAEPRVLRNTIKINFQIRGRTDTKLFLSAYRTPF